MTITPQNKNLAESILAFLKKFAGKDASDPKEFSSPDATEMWRFAQQLLAGQDPKTLRVPASDWGSGGYKPYISEKGRRLHHQLMNQCRALVK